MSPIETSRSWTHFRVDRHNFRYCHVTFDHPPINTITATTVAELSNLVTVIEQNPDLNVVVRGRPCRSGARMLRIQYDVARFPKDKTFYA